MGVAARTKTGTEEQGMTIGRPWVGERGPQKTTAGIMADPTASKLRAQFYVKGDREIPGRRSRPQNPGAIRSSQYPLAAPGANSNAPIPSAPQTIGTNFTGATLAETGSIPPDTMGAVGPSQFVVLVNGKLRTFNKTTGVADGVLNANPDTFFASVMTPVVNPAINFTFEPQVRYDRLSARWILLMIDVPSSSPSSIQDMPNRLLLAVSDAASAGVISGGTVWTFYFVQQNTVGGGDTLEYLDFPSLGVDNNALYVGGDMFTASTGAFTGSSVFVIRKTTALSGGPLVTTAFRGLVPNPATSEGMLDPRGMDNYNPTANEGYFIGTSNLLFGELVMRRISTPGGTPAISADILIPVNATAFPIPVDHLGNTGGIAGRLESIDDRLFAAHIRNGRLWTAHNIAVDATGVASNGPARRTAVRWYELNVPVGSGTPTVVQSGTIFDSGAAVANARQYWMPTAMVSGQGHAALGFSTAGTPNRADAATNGRLSGDSLGTLGAPAFYTTSSTAYNPAADPGGANGRSWGNYSFTSLDPKDDMTMWTIQEFCDATDSYGVRAAKLIAPPPAAPASVNTSVPSGQTSVVVIVTGTSAAGSGFFDPGSNLAPPALPFTHISASVSGGVTVNNVIYTDPTHVTLDLNTTAAAGGTKDVTLTNPDGQFATGVGILTVTGGPPPLTLSSAVSRKAHAGAGTFDVNLPLGSPFGIECRSGSGSHTLVFTFSNSVTSGSASVTTGTGTVSGSPVFSGNTMTVNLTGVTDVQLLTVTLSGVTDTFAQVLPNTPVSAKFLIGDTNANSSVSASDVGQTKAQSGITVTIANFREDVTPNGTINAADIGLVKAGSGHSVP